MTKARLHRREFGLGVFASGIALGLGGTSWAGAAKPAVSPDRFALVDPELVEAVRALPDFTVDGRSLPILRGVPARPVAPAPAPQPAFRSIPGPKGAPDVRVMVIDGTGGKPGSPAYLHMHGGGFVGGRVDRSPAAYQALAEACGCLIVSVDYRLAPETRFPGALEDNYAALRWLHSNADALGIDPKRIAIGGESAGGGHAAMLAIAARDRGEFPVVFQLLIYPMLDDRTGAAMVQSPHLGNFVWNAGSNRFGWASLLGQAPGLKTVQYGSVPARVTDLTGLPPSFIAVGGLDLFAGENIAFAARLNAAAVPVELLLVPGAYHAFDSIVPTAKISRRFRAAIVDSLKRGMAVQ